MLSLNPSELTIPKLHQLLLGSVGPRPICFASTVDKDGNRNLAPFSFFNVFSANPPILVFLQQEVEEQVKVKTHTRMLKKWQKWLSMW